MAQKYVRPNSGHRGPRQGGPKRVNQHDSPQWIAAHRNDEPMLMDVLEYRDDGEARTRADIIIDTVAHNLPMTEAAAAAGVSTSALQSWLRAGANVAAERAAMEQGKTSKKAISKRDEALWWFHREMDVAVAAGERRLVEALDARATGELTAAVITRELVPDPSGKVDEQGRPLMIEVKRTEKRNKVLPDTAAIMALLRTRYPERWAGTDRLEVVGSGAIEHRVVHTVEHMESMLEKVAKRITDPIDTSVSEIPALTDGDGAD